MSETKDLICIGCPVGCSLQVILEQGKVVEVRGNSCPKGKSYGEKECTNPTRIVTSLVKVKGGEIKVVSVKTEKDIPKEKIIQCIEDLKGIIVEAPVNLGDIILENVAHTGVNVIATKSVLRID